mmetsp:Transcript_29871/g.26422  ORF Transcript_29871/g.26422 Transcript_29871/m.26422 type:complete len:265 (+) Transcript_29871:17-811(+)
MTQYKPEELEVKLEEKARKKFNFEIEEKWEEGKALPETTTDALIHGEFGNGSAFIEILSGEESKLVVTYNFIKLDDDEEEKKEDKTEKDDDKTLVKVYSSTKSNAYFIIPEKELGDVSSKAIIKKILTWLKPQSILLLDSMFKTSYASFDYIGDANIIKYMKSSCVTDDLSKTGAEPVDVTNGISGLNGGLLLHSEIHRVPCVLFLSVIDSYDFTLETFGSYEGILSYSSALKSHIKDVSALIKRDNYKPTLKKYNQKKHNIYN